MQSLNWAFETINPTAVFRAENSFTHRHLTEFTGLDLEMTIEEHYHEVVDVLDSMLLHIFNGLKTKYRYEKRTKLDQVLMCRLAPISRPLGEYSHPRNLPGWRKL